LVSDIEVSKQIVSENRMLRIAFVPKDKRVRGTCMVRGLHNLYDYLNWLSGLGCTHK